MTNHLPLYINLILGFLLMFVFTGTWAIINDLSKLLANSQSSRYFAQIRAALAKIRIRRVFALLVGAALIALYFFEKSTTGLFAIVFCVFFLDSLSLTTKTRKFIQTIKE